MTVAVNMEPENGVWAMKVKGPDTNGQWRLYFNAEGHFEIPNSILRTVERWCEEMRKKHPVYEYEPCQLIPVEGVEPIKI